MRMYICRFLAYIIAISCNWQALSEISRNIDSVNTAVETMPYVFSGVGKALQNTTYNNNVERFVNDLHRDLNDNLPGYQSNLTHGLYEQLHSFLGDSRSMDAYVGRNKVSLDTFSNDFEVFAALHALHHNSEIHYMNTYFEMNNALKVKTKEGTTQQVYQTKVSLDGKDVDVFVDENKNLLTSEQACYEDPGQCFETFHNLKSGEEKYDFIFISTDHQGRLNVKLARNNYPGTIMRSKFDKVKNQLPYYLSAYHPVYFPVSVSDVNFAPGFEKALPDGGRQNIGDFVNTYFTGQNKLRNLEIDAIGDTEIIEAKASYSEVKNRFFEQCNRYTYLKLVLNDFKNNSIGFAVKYAFVPLLKGVVKIVVPLYNGQETQLGLYCDVVDRKNSVQEAFDRWNDLHTSICKTTHIAAYTRLIDAILLGRTTTAQYVLKGIAKPLIEIFARNDLFQNNDVLAQLRNNMRNVLTNDSIQQGVMQGVSDKSKKVLRPPYPYSVSIHLVPSDTTYHVYQQATN